MSILNTDLNNINVNDNNYDENMIILIPQVAKMC